jgi:hypothetical protein
MPFDPAKKAVELSITPPQRRDHGYTLRDRQGRLGKSTSGAYSQLSVYIKIQNHRRLKGKAGMEGIEMSDVVEQLIEKWVSGQVEL